MKEQFKNYLTKRLSPNSANSYLSGLNHLSRDYGKNILDIVDVIVISEIRKLYDIGGAKHSIGNYGNGSARNALTQYFNFLVELSGEGSPQPDASISVDEPEPATTRFTYERDLHNTLERQAAELFPDYQLVGREYLIGTSRLDFLFEKDKQFLIVELKTGIATYEVFGQISMYIGLVKAKYPEYVVHGLIIASEIHEGLQAACTTSTIITYKTYKMRITLENS